VQVFILKGLRGAYSVNVAYAGVTEANFARIGTIWKNGVDSIGFAKQEI